MTFQQADFVKALLNPLEPVPYGMRSIASRHTKRFNVYRNNVVTGLVSALETAFPVIRKLVGDKFFAAMAGEFVRNHPPRSPLMMFYGEEMPQFLERFDPVSHLPYLPDIARLELELRRSYHAADSVPVDTEVAGTVPPDRLLEVRLKLAPSLRYLRSGYPICGIWRANMAGGPKPVARAEDVVISRVRFDPQLAMLEPGGFEFLEAVTSGRTLGGALESVLAAVPDFRLDRMLGLLLNSCAVTSFSLAEAEIEATEQPSRSSES